MTDFIIKSAISMLVLLAVYHLFLEKEKMHRFNRFFLLGALVFSLALPFVKIPVYVAEPVVKSVITPQAVQLQSQEIIPLLKKQPDLATIPVVATPEVNYWSYLGFGLYGLVTLILALRFGINISRFYRLKKKNTTTAYKDITLVLLENDIVPHTFLGNIFIRKIDYENRLIEPELFDHEMAHVKQHHTLDILFVETLKTLFWFNPLLYFYKRAIQLNHEFLADDTAINEHRNIPVYQQLLLEKATPVVTYPLASSINFSITKKRFIMMTKTTDKTKSVLLKFAVLPVTVGLLYFLSTETIIYAKGITAGKAAGIANSVTEGDPALEAPAKEAIAAQLGKDTIAGDARRDEYYKGVKITINDKQKDIAITKPYERLTIEQKRYYLQTVPKKKPVNGLGVNPADYNSAVKNENTIFYIDENKVTKEEFLKYKKENFAYYASKSTGILTKNRKVETGTPQAFFYTQSFYNKNIRPIYDHYPSEACNISISATGQKIEMPDINTSEIDSINVNPVTRAELDSLRTADPKKYKETDLSLYSKITMVYKEKGGTRKKDVVYPEAKKPEKPALKEPFTDEDGQKMNVNDIVSITVLPVTQAEIDALKKTDPKKYEKATVSSMMKVNVVYRKDGEEKLKTEYREKTDY